MADLFVTLGEGSAEIVEKKSRFIAAVIEIHSEQEALDHIENKRRQYWDARHNCYAFVAGKNNEIQRFSDDKEPSGTAGRPILEVLLGASLHNTLIVVTRYFGGVLLGTGGLVRAYSGASQAAIEACRAEGKIRRASEGFLVTFSCDYRDAGKFENLFARMDIPVLNKEYGAQAGFTAAVEEGKFAAFSKAALDMTSGAVRLSPGESSTFCLSASEALPYRF